ncbi:MAG TPA: aspartate kinase [Candidatus Obscuribacterales bacterium]
MSQVSVLKFGGTSVKNIGRIRHVAEIVAANPSEKKLVILSAMGDTTDHLLALSLECAEDPDKRELDLLLSTGEQVSIVLLALTLKSLGIKAKSFTGAQIGIYTDDAHGNANIRHIDPVRLHNALRDCDVAVIAGFQGVSYSGETTTLGRGGSDTTAVAVAAACNASICEIYTDVDGVFDCDPNRHTEAQLIDSLSYDRALDLAQNGAQVVHDKAIQLAREHAVKLRVRNTFNPGYTGSLISA